MIPVARLLEDVAHRFSEVRAVDNGDHGKFPFGLLNYTLIIEPEGDILLIVVPLFPQHGYLD